MVDNQNITIDMWQGKRFAKKKYYADAYFYPHGSFGYIYRGWIYDGATNMIGDYGANDSSAIIENFKIEREGADVK